ncbi:MAG: BRO family protein [Eubacteriales bacterium]|nr:BRO family protein [Eubacteriales bacterium]
MSELQVFSNAEFGSVRSITVNGEPYFVGKDVAAILGYGNTRDALIAHVDEEDRTVIQKSEIIAGWGKLKSGAGWIALDHCTKV